MTRLEEENNKKILRISTKRYRQLLRAEEFIMKIRPFVFNIYQSLKQKELKK